MVGSRRTLLHLLALTSILACAGDGGPTQPPASCSFELGVTSGAPGALVPLTFSTDALDPATMYAEFVDRASANTSLGAIVHDPETGSESLRLTVPLHPGGVDQSGPVTVTLTDGTNRCSARDFTITAPDADLTGTAVAIFTQMEHLRALQDTVLGIDVGTAQDLSTVPPYLHATAMMQRLFATGALRIPRDDYATLTAGGKLLVDGALARAGVGEALEKAILVLHDLHSLQQVDHGARANRMPESVSGLARQSVGVSLHRGGVQLDGFAFGGPEDFISAVKVQQAAETTQGTVDQANGVVGTSMLALLPGFLVPGSTPVVASAEGVLAEAGEMLSAVSLGLGGAQGALPNDISNIDVTLGTPTTTAPPTYAIDAITVTPESRGFQFSSLVDTHATEYVLQKLFGRNLGNTALCGAARAACDELKDRILDPIQQRLRDGIDAGLRAWGVQDRIHVPYQPVRFHDHVAFFNVAIETDGAPPPARLGGEYGSDIIADHPGVFTLVIRTNERTMAGILHEQRIRYRVDSDLSVHQIDSPRRQPDCAPCGGNSVGDPHLRTFDGLAYDFQGAGEFVLVESTEGALLVEARQEPVSTRVSVNTAAAVNVAGDRVGFYAKRESHVYINGTAVDLAQGRTDLARGGRIFRDGDSYVVVWPDNMQAEAHIRGQFLDLAVYPSDARKTKLRGLLGNYDGATDNDLMMRGGAQLTLPPSFTKLYSEYGESWRISGRESLFDYVSGTSTETFTDRDFPAAPATVADLSVQARQAADQVCRSAGVTDPVLLENCILDVGITGDPRFAESASEALTPIKKVNLDGTLVLNEPVTGRIAAAGQIVSYQFTVGAAQEVYVHTSQSDDALRNVGITLLGPNGEPIGTGCFSCADLGRLNLVGPGSYTLRVGSASATGTGAYSVTVFAVSRQTFDVALDAVITPDAHGAGAIERIGDVDVYRFAGSAGQEVFFDLDQVDGSMNEGDAILISPTGAEVKRGCFGCIDPGELVLSATGVYTIEVGSAHRPVVGRYGLGIYAVQRDVKAVSINSVNDGRIEKPGSFDVYTFDAAAGERISLSLTGVESDIALLDFVIEDDAGNTLIKTCLGCLLPQTITLTRGGTYRIVVGSTRDDGIGAYTLTLARQ